MKYALAAMAAALTLTGTASADYLKGDPRVCSMGPARKADCAEAAATYTLVMYMRHHGHRSFSNPTTATPLQKNLLKWRVDFGTGTAIVWFRALSTGWVRQVTVTMN